MLRPPPGSTLTYPLFPSTTLFRSQIGAFAVRRGAIAIARQFARDDIRILAKLDAALQRGVARLDDEALALRRGKLRLEARDIGLERGRAAGQRQRRARDGGKGQPPAIDLVHRPGSVIRWCAKVALSIP